MSILTNRSAGPRQTHPIRCPYSQPHERDRVYNKCERAHYPKHQDHCEGTRQHYTAILPPDARGNDKCSA